MENWASERATWERTFRCGIIQCNCGLVGECAADVAAVWPKVGLCVHITMATSTADVAKQTKDWGNKLECNFFVSIFVFMFQNWFDFHCVDVNDFFLHWPAKRGSRSESNLNCFSRLILAPNAWLITLNKSEETKKHTSIWNSILKFASCTFSRRWPRSPEPESELELGCSSSL